MNGRFYEYKIIIWGKSIMKTKKIVYMALIFCILAIQYLPVAGAEHQSSKLNQLEVGETVNLGYPIEDAQILGCSTVVDKNGDTIFYGVTSGPPALFYVYNVDADQVLARHYLQAELPYGNGTYNYTAKVAYAVDVGPDGIVNIATQSNTLFFRYDPKTDELKCYGRIEHDGTAETAVMHQGVFDSEGNYYFGTYPNAMLIRYNVKTDKLEQLAKNLVVGDYVKAMSIYDDKIYAGALGYQDTGTGAMICNFVEYDTKTGQVTEMPKPNNPGVFASDQVQNFYVMSQAGKYAIAKCKVIIGSTTPYYDCVFDMEKKEWVDYIKSSNHLHYTDFDGDVIYTSKGVSGGSAMFCYNPETKVETRLTTGTYPSTYMVKPKIVTLKDQVNYPGKTIVAGANDSGMLLYNFEKQTMTFRKEELPYGPMQIRTLQEGGENEILLSAYMGAKAVLYDTGKDEIKAEYPSTQIEGIAYIDGKYYTGMYGGGAYLQEIDFSQPAVSGKNPRKLGAMSTHQDRAFLIADGDTDIIWGSVPNYGYLGGDVAFYNKQTGAVRIVEQPVPNQSIAGLLYIDGKVYGSTNVQGGLNTTPYDAPAKLFRMDAATGTVEQVVDIRLATDTRRQYFAGGLTLLPNGKIMVGLQKTLAIVNPSDLRIEKEIPVGTATASLLTSARWMPFDVILGKDGLIYTNVGRELSAVDWETGEVKQIRNFSAGALALSSEGNLYYFDGLGTALLKTSVKTGEETAPSVTTFQSTFIPDSKESSYTFGTVMPGNKTTVKEETLRIGADGCYKLKAEKELSMNGHYGIEIKGSLLSNTAYYTRTYVIYQSSDGTESTVYGQIKTIDLTK